MDITNLVRLDGLFQGEVGRINKINKLYDIYEGKQEWITASELDYEPTKKVTNYIKKLIDKKARFMFGKEPYFNITSDNSTQAEQKEELLQKILKSNQWHSKLLKAKKDCSIGGKVAIKLWADTEQGLKIIFSPAQEFITQYSIDDIDTLEKVIFFYSLNDEQNKTKQRIKKQTWELINNQCVMNEGIYDGYGKLIQENYKDFYNGLDFIPVIIIQNGGLTGATQGYSDVKTLWQDQDSYNKLKSDDIDALKFQMFGQTVFTDTSEDTLDNVIIAPSALIDLQTDITKSEQGRQATISRLESSFNYGSKYESTINRIKADMYDLMDMPDTSLEQLKGMMASGKSMRAIYWDLMATCDEEWTEWRPKLELMAKYIFRLVDVYNLYNKSSIARYEADLKIENYYPIPEDEIEQRKMDLNEVVAGLKSKRTYIKKWSDVEDIDEEIKNIIIDKQSEDDYGLDE